jgi:hypothetical protein
MWYAREKEFGASNIILPLKAPVYLAFLFSYAKNKNKCFMQVGC